MKKTVLITGATGFLGSHLVKKLLSQGYCVVILKRESSNIERIEKELASIQYQNIENINWDSFFSKHQFDGIIHTANCYGRANETEQEIFDVNVDLPKTLLAYSIKYKLKYFINTGTSLPRFLNNYATTKWIFSDILKLFSSQINAVNILPEYFYGPGDDNSKLITSIIHKLNNNVPKIDFTSGTQKRDFIYIDDVVEGFFTVIQNIDKLAHYTEIPMGSTEILSIKEVVLKINEILKADTQLNFGAIPNRPGELESSKADISVLKNLGWRSQINFVDGLQKTINLDIQ